MNFRRYLPDRGAVWSLASGLLLALAFPRPDLGSLAWFALVPLLLVVAESADEGAYVPELEAAGYVLRIREPDWHQHRVLVTRREAGESAADDGDFFHLSQSAPR